MTTQSQPSALAITVVPAEVPRDWKPLYAVLRGLTAEMGSFMFMRYANQAVSPVDGRGGTAGLYLYKHRDTRRYLNVDGAGNCWKYDSDTGTYRPISRSQALQEAYS